MINSLKNDEFDVLVIGGGATGCGVALDAVSRGCVFINCKNYTVLFIVFKKCTAFWCMLLSNAGESTPKSMSLGQHFLHTSRVS